MESSESNANAVDLPEVNEVIIRSQLPARSPFRLDSSGPEAQTAPDIQNPAISNHFTGCECPMGI